MLDRNGTYAGMVAADDIKTALLQREAIPLLTVAELVRPELAPSRTRMTSKRGQNKPDRIRRRA